jgi:hypothetical protein
MLGTRKHSLVLTGFDPERGDAAHVVRAARNGVHARADVRRIHPEITHRSEAPIDSQRARLPRRELRGALDEVGVVERGDRRERWKPGGTGELLADTAVQLRTDEQGNLGGLTKILDQCADVGLRTPVQHESTDPELQRTSDARALTIEARRRVPADGRDEQLSDVPHGRVI